MGTRRWGGRGTHPWKIPGGATTKVQLKERDYTTLWSSLIKQKCLCSESNFCTLNVNFVSKRISKVQVNGTGVTLPFGPNDQITVSSATV